ncbi:uncharacterized protein [Rutidosis leptorrhynchoides]|uniref:uncharacterized protein n=1 Tax=Rutidosis leptorrhynchoides TaxID=125765 RepID=UPI003A98D89A
MANRQQKQGTKRKLGTCGTSEAIEISFPVVRAFNTSCAPIVVHGYLTESGHGVKCLHMDNSSSVDIIFGIPDGIVSDNGTQFEGNPFLSWCQDLNIKQSFTSIVHPQANGQGVVTNRDIIHAIKARLRMKRKGWVNELPKVLWTHRTMHKKIKGEMPFSLVYGSEAVIPAEITISTERILSYNEEENDEKLHNNLDYEEERREMVAIREAANKQRIVKYYDRRVRARMYKMGDLVWRDNQASRAQNTGKLGPNWEGPYKVIEIGKTRPTNWQSSRVIQLSALGMLPCLKNVIGTIGIRRIDQSPILS